MGGQIDVRSRVGEGSTFSFTCALASASEADVPQPERRRARRGARFTGHVLVVDDNAVNRLLASKVVQSLGCTFECAQNGAEALEKLKQGRFDLVLMDCSMPVMDGFEATRKIRTTSGLEELPVVALTAYVLADDRARCKEAGMDDYIAKPIRLSELERALGRYLKETPEESSAA